MDFIAQFLSDSSTLLSESSTEVISFGVIIIIVIFLMSVFGKMSKPKGANLSTSIGIAFTFLGIVAGLSQFDSADLYVSAQTLIEGLKIAFITSLVGIISAVVLKTLDKSNGNGGRDMAREDLDNKILIKISESIDTLNQSLSGDEEGSLLGQMKNLRQDMNDRNKELKNSLDDFAAKISENHTEEMVKALEKVLKDLETQIQQHLGNSFIEFSKSVDNLVAWQTQYKEIIIRTTDELTVVLKSFAEVNETIQGINNNNNAARRLNNDIKEQLDVHKDQIGEIRKTLEGIGSIPDQFTRTKEGIDAMVASIENSNKSIIEQFNHLEKGISDSAQKINGEIVQSLQHFRDATPTAINELDTSLSRTVSEFEVRISGAVQRLNELLSRIQKDDND